MNKEYLEALNKAFDYGVQSVLDNLLLRGYSTKNLLEQELLGKTLKKELDEAKEDIRDIETINHVLTRLEVINNAKPNEALKDLEELDNIFYLDKKRKSPGGNTREEYEFYPSDTKEYGIVENYILKAQEMEKENAKYNQALNTIFKKGFDRTIKDYKDYDIWLEEKIEQFSESIEKHPTILNWDMFDDFTYTKDEFALLKGMLK